MTPEDMKIEKKTKNALNHTQLKTQQGSPCSVTLTHYLTQRGNATKIRQHIDIITYRQVLVHHNLQFDSTRVLHKMELCCIKALMCVCMRVYASMCVCVCAFVCMCIHVLYVDALSWFRASTY